MAESSNNDALPCPPNSNVCNYKQFSRSQSGEPGAPFRHVHRVAVDIREYDIVTDTAIGRLHNTLVHSAW